MKGHKEVKISYWAAHLTTIVSVTLVMLIIGAMALVSVAAANETRRLKEKIEISVVMADGVSDGRADTVCALLSSQAFVREAHLITKDEALRNWTADTGEDLQALFGVNPLSPEISLRVAADYANPAGIAGIARAVGAMDGVESVALPDSEMVDRMNRNIERTSWVLGVVALALVVISFVLINNTVHLSVYARRFTIHTMQLVGATDGFIRRPYVVANMLTGALAGVLASGILAAGMAVSGASGIDLAALAGWGAFGIVAGALTVAGALLCGLAAAIASTRYLHRDYDRLFR